MTVNKAILVGNLGAKPELRHTGGGTPVTELRIATSNRRKVNEEWVDETEWHSVVVFGKTAENCERYLDKGRQVYIEGRIQTRSWDGQDGQKHYKTEIVAFDVKFLSPQPSNQSRGPSSQQGGYQRSDAPPPRSEPSSGMESDLPF